MKSYLKSDVAYKTIGEVTKMLGLIDKKTGHLQTHTLRYWETQFKQIRPLIRACLLYTSPSPRDRTRSRMPSSA